MFDPIPFPLHPLPMIDLSLLVSMLAFLISILSAYYSKTLSDSAREELKLHEKELNSSNERFLSGKSEAISSG
jgi:hypothetical protein